MANVECVKKSECTGCEACGQACPVKCITFITDEEGFRYPSVGEGCINCSKCINVCSQRKPAGENKNREVECWAAYVKDENVLMVSSSGGVFTILAQKILDEGGIVFGAALEGMKVVHRKVAQKADLYKIQKSKYLQSNIGKVYIEVKDFLEEDKKVLFSGTPCQVAGLYAFLQKDYSELITCDVICHGVPSETVFNKFVKYEEKKYGSKIEKFYWRDKRNGWHRNSIVEFFENGKEVVRQSMQHPFQRGFLDNLYLRPSCYSCSFTGIPRVADISLGDYWQADKNNPDLESQNANRGMSIVILSTQKGKQLFEAVKEDAIVKRISIEVVKEASRHSYLPPLQNPNRDKFFLDLSKRTYPYLVKKYIFTGDPKVKMSLKIKILLKKYVDKLLKDK